MRVALPVAGRSLLAAAALVLVMALHATTAAAQACVGTAPFSAGTGRIGAVALHNENAEIIGATLSVGVSRGPFATASIGRLSIDAAREAVPIFGALVGVGIDVGRRSRHPSVQVCPFVGYESAGEAQVDLGLGIPVEVESDAYRAGLAIGNVLPLRSSLSLVPNASLSYVNETATTRQGGFSRAILEDYGVLDGGLGVVLSRIVTIQLAMSIPLGLEDGTSTIGLGFGINFGGGAER